MSRKTFKTQTKPKPNIQKTFVPDTYYKKAIQDTLVNGVPRFRIREKLRADIMVDQEND